MIEMMLMKGVAFVQQAVQHVDKYAQCREEDGVCRGYLVTSEAL